jgi:hypothetical protein
MGLLAIILALALQAAGPTVTIEAPEQASVATGSGVSFTVRVDLAGLPPGTEVRVRSLALKNLGKLGSESGADVVTGASGPESSRWFRYTVAPTEPGAATVGPVEIEIRVAGEEQPRILQAEGFALEAFEPFDWNKLPAWVPWTIGVVILGLVWVFFGRIVTRRVRSTPLDEAGEERRRQFEELNLKLRRGDYREAADSAFGIILDAYRHTGRGIATAASADSDLRAAIRLGEEVRYAGYRPDRGEAAFIIRVANGEAERAYKDTKGQGDEHRNHRSQRKGKTGK